jgi:hypothetical protein
MYPDGVEGQVDYLPFQYLLVQAGEQFEGFGYAVATADDPKHFTNEDRCIASSTQFGQ